MYYLYCTTQCYDFVFSSILISMQHSAIRLWIASGFHCDLSSPARHTPHHITANINVWNEAIQWWDYIIKPYIIKRISSVVRTQPYILKLFSPWWQGKTLGLVIKFISWRQHSKRTRVKHSQQSHILTYIQTGSRVRSFTAYWYTFKHSLPYRCDEWRQHCWDPSPPDQTDSDALGCLCPELQLSITNSTQPFNRVSYPALILSLVHDVTQGCCCLFDPSTPASSARCIADFGCKLCSGTQD